MENPVKRFSFGRHRETWQGFLLDQPVENDVRCRDCDGFCCRFFPTVNLTWSEFETLKGLGARRLSFSLNGQYKLMIENGCEFQIQGKCSIYRYRPDICRRFICQKKSSDQTGFAIFPYVTELLSLRWGRRKSKVYS
jgi:hypothetical protein